MADDPEFPIVHRVERDDMSSSAIVVRATGPIQQHGIEITLEPLRHPVTKIDVYPEELEGLLRALLSIVKASEEAEDGN